MLVFLIDLNYTAAALGFVGLGQMGSPMAVNLMKMNMPIYVYDKNSANMSAFERTTSSIAELAKLSTCIFTMLPNDQIVEEVYLSSNGLLEKCSPNTIFVDCSTVSPSTAKKLSKEAKNKFCVSIDAPVSGGGI